MLDIRGNTRLDYPPPSYLLKMDEIGEYLDKLKEGKDNIMIDPVTGRKSTSVLPLLLIIA